MPRGGGGFGRSGHRGLGGGFSRGPVGYCICPNCGQRLPHEIAVPCYSKKCPKCNSPMMRG